MELGLCAIGLGGLGHIMLDVYAEMDRVEIVAGADISEAARDLFESRFDAPAYESHTAMLDAHDDLDAATIVTPHTLHFEQAAACLDRGLHVMLEKPMVTSIEDGLALLAAADERDLVLQVGYQRHFHPVFTEIRRLVRSGRIGTLHTVNCHLGQDWVTPHQGTWRVDPALSGGGQLYDTGSHLLDALLWTTETTPDSVDAVMEYEKPQIDVNSALSLALDRQGETVIGSVGISGNGVEMSPEEGYVYWGDGGRITYTGNRLVVAEKGAATYEATITEGTDFRTLTAAKLGNFVDSVLGRAEPAVPGEYGLQVTALTEAAYRADREGRRVDVQACIEEARDALDD